jgi:hypothetical protein
MMTDAQDEILHAETETDAGATIRLRGYQTDDGWLEAVEVVDGDDDHVTTLYEGHGLKPTAVYNQTIEAFVDDEGNQRVQEEA